MTDEIWLSRTLIEGPFLALVLAEADFIATLNHLEVPEAARPGWLRPGFNGCVHHFITGRGEAANVVCIGPTEGRDPIEVAGLLVHEAVHVVQNIVADMGERAPGDEFMAYVTQNVAMRLMDSYRKQTAPRPRKRLPPFIAKSRGWGIS